jgi:cyclopropane fatty-acyl-phospholipid synthase-like methyltransferase
LAAAWLGFKMPFFDEIIVNPRQGKSEETYWNMLSDALQELNRVLKPKGRMTVLLHGENEKYFRRFRDLLNNYKFKEVSNSFKKYTFKNGLHEKDDKRLNGDYYLTLERIL